MYTFKIVTKKFNPNNEKNVMDHSKFFSLSELKQPVNQWLCIAFISLFCFWTIILYVADKAEAVANNLFAPTSSTIR